MEPSELLTKRVDYLVPLSWKRVAVTLLVGNVTASRGGGNYLGRGSRLVSRVVQ